MLRPHVHPRVLASLAALAALAFASCHRSHHDDVVIVVPHYDLWEIEPNDSANSPDGIGPLAVGDSLIIGGTLTELGPDFLDGFAFQSVEPCDIEFSLEAFNDFADFDLCVYDPQAGAYAFCFDSGGPFENGRFTLSDGGIDFHLVLSSFDGASEYRLRVDCVPPTFGLAPEAAGAPRVDAFERYGAPESLEDELDVIARGVAIEIDLATGDVRETELEVRRRSE